MRSPCVFCALLLLASCDGSGCVDTDLDTYGPGCEAGEDCDPDNAARNVDCASIPPPDCAVDPSLTGCPCLPGSVSLCLSENDGVGICRAGRASCVNDFWNICVGGVAPLSEFCDGQDQDCDGLIDEGVVSPCGGCTPGCLGGVWGEGPEPFEAGGDLALTRFGELTLAIVEQRFGSLWVANSGEGTLSRIDVERAVETARYPTGGIEPSRVAVDYLGDAWVLNREFDGSPTATKIAGDASRCVDRDMDGLETSSGPSDVLAIDEDECVLLHVPVGEALGVARSIAIDGDTGLDGVSGGDPWIGLHDGEVIVELDGLTGAELRRVETPGFAPYASTFDPWGILWVISRDGHLARIDPRPAVPTLEIFDVPLPCFLLYGLASDTDGRLLMTGFSCDRIVSYDPALDLWQTRASAVSPRAATFDGELRFWIAHTASMASSIELEPQLHVEETYSLSDGAITPLETIGIAVDAFGQVWTVSSQGGEGDRGVATRLDPETGEVTAQVTVGRSPHVQGDLTGNRVRYRLAPRAEATHVFEGCGALLETAWLTIHVAADPGAYGRVLVDARHAPSRDALSSASWVRLGEIPGTSSPYPLSFPEGGVVEVRLTLEVDGRAGAPRVRRVGVEWRCPGPD